MSATDLVAAVAAAEPVILLTALGDRITVSAFTNTHDTQAALAATNLELPDGSDLWLVPQLLSSPATEAVRADFAAAVDPDELQQAIESVNRTGIAQLAGMETFLTHARHLLIDVSPKSTSAMDTAPVTATEVVVIVHRLVLENGLIDVAPGGEEFTAAVVIDPLQTPASRESLIWPLERTPATLPVIVGPLMDMALNIVGAQA